MQSVCHSWATCRSWMSSTAQCGLFSINLHCAVCGCRTRLSSRRQAPVRAQWRRWHLVRREWWRHEKTRRRPASATWLSSISRGTMGLSWQPQHELMTCQLMLSTIVLMSLQLVVTRMSLCHQRISMQSTQCQSWIYIQRSVEDATIHARSPAVDFSNHVKTILEQSWELYRNTM